MGGIHIAPVDGAVIEEYDPFQTEGEQRPYTELLAAYRSGSDDLLRWVARYGLLGILLHQTTDAFFWPRWEDAGLVSGIMSGNAIRQLRYRVGQPFESVVFEQTSEAGHPAGVPAEPEELRAMAGQELWGAPLPPRVRHIDPHTGKLESVDVSEGYGQFFARVPGVCAYAAHLWKSRYSGAPWVGEPPPGCAVGPEELGEELNHLEYPEPLTQAFFAGYGEPISLIRSYAHALEDTVFFWERARKAPSIRPADPILPPGSILPVDSIVPTYWQVKSRFPPTFMAAMSAVQPTAVPSDSGSEGVHWRPGYHSRSLYASLNAMVLQDYALRGVRMLQCTRCGQLFVTPQYNKKYCSSRCQKAAEQARRRERHQARRSRMLKNLEEST